MEDSLTSPKRFMEYSPVERVTSNNEVTYVKEPYDPEQDSQNSYIPNGQTRYCENNDGSPISTPETQTENDCSGYNMDASEYSKEVKDAYKLYKSLPKEMFVSRLVMLCSSNENKLDDLRCSLLDVLKEDDDFPYGLQAVPKRRIHSRNGDSVAVKLAYDVHALASVISGADYSEIKDLFSSGKGGNRGLSTPCKPNRGVKCRDDANLNENKSFLQEIAGIRAEMLSLKQVYAGAEKLRTDQINALKTSVISVKSEMQSLTQSVKESLNTIKLGIERIESEKCSGIVQMKAELRTLKDVVKGIQDSVDNVQTCSLKQSRN